MRNNRDIIPVYQFELSQSQQLNSSGFSNCDNMISQLNNATHNNIFLYPNLSVDYLILELYNRSERINHIYCYNYLGQSIPLYTENFSNTRYRFNVSDLNPGIYTIEIVLKNSSRITQKFIAE